MIKKRPELTLEEKCLLLTGKNGWLSNDLDGKVPSISFADGPHGLRKIKEGEIAYPDTAFPTLSVLSNTWSTEYANKMGSAIADACIERDVDILLAPGVNIKRTPLNGRNFEYFSEDPLLSGFMARAYIQGLQQKGIGATLKHFCANNREFDRFYQSSEVDERALWEIYLLPFAIAVEANPWLVMCSYPPVNGVFASENKKLLNDILRKKLKWHGVIVSDWCAVHSRWRALRATLDLEMPYNENSFQNLLTAYERGFISDNEIASSVERLYELIEKVEANRKNRKVDSTREARHSLAKEIASSGIVLLKNESNLLPLKEPCSLTVAGKYAEEPPLGGGGSAMVTSDYQQTTLTQLLQVKGFSVKYHAVYGSKPYADTTFCQKSALESAYSSDAVIVAVGNNHYIESEHFDRSDLRLPKTQVDLIQKIASINPNTIVLIYAGSCVDVSEWIDSVRAVLYVGFAGEGCNEALCDLLTGVLSPCGKLTETFPRTLTDTFCGDKVGSGFVERYDDSIFVGYRYYEKENILPMFPFGYGLSYADFQYSDLQIQKLGDTEFELNYTIENISEWDAYEISQVYVKDVFCSVSRPKKELKGFHRDLIRAQEKKKISIRLDWRAFAYYSTAYDDWHIENGDFEILIGASSVDIRLRKKIRIELPEETQHSEI